MARNPLQYTWLVLLLVMVTGASILATTVGGTLERSQRDQVQYEIGADLRISRFPKFFGGDIRTVQQDFFESGGGVESAMALRTTGSIGISNVQVLAMESRQFSDVSWYREDFSERSINQVMDSLEPNFRMEQIQIPDEVDKIGVWVKSQRISQHMSLWMVVQDSAGVLKTLTLGEILPTRWNLYQADIPFDLTPPLHLVSIQIFEPGEGAVLTSGSILLDDIHGFTTNDSKEFVLEDFESLNRWLPIPTSANSLDRIVFSADNAYRGEKAGLFVFGPIGNKSIRGFYDSSFGANVPVVSSSSLLSDSGYNVGDELVANIAGRLTPVVIRDSVELFPTMNPNSGFLLADLDVLLNYANMIGQQVMLKPNELFVNRTHENDESVDALADELRAQFIEVTDVTSSLAAVRVDSIAITGWRATVLLSIAIVLLSSAVGYGSYLFLYKDRSHGETGFLQSLGFSKMQMISLLGFEHLIIVAIGLGLGTWAGLRMSGLIVSQLAVTHTGEKVVPPFILQMDWSLMGPTYVVLIAVLMFSQAILNRAVHRVDLQTIARFSG